VSPAVRTHVFGLVALVACGCRRSSEAAPQPAPVAAASTADAGVDPERPVVIDPTRDLDSCALGHRGVLVDFGDPSTRTDLRLALAAAAAAHTFAGSDDEVVEHGGATWLRLRSRTISVSFYWPESEVGPGNAYVEAHVRGVTARGMALSIDGKGLGSATFAKGDSSVLTIHASTPLTLAPGGHELTLHLVGGPRSSGSGSGGGEPLAEVDWVHVGTGEPGEPYAAPTRSDALVDAMVGGRSLRALSIRAPGFVRCSGWIPASATLEASLATAGGGDGDVEARLLRDRRPSVLLGTAHVAGGADAWSSWSVPVVGLEGHGAIAAVQIVVTRATKGTRVLIGDPRVVALEPSAAAPPPPARGVVLVVLGSTAAKTLAPWGGPHPAIALTSVAASGTTFLASRATSTIADAAVASMLTGLPARATGIDDPEARLPDGPTTVEEACRQGGVATALFTANPTTGAAFGFERGWDEFEALDPVASTPATQVFDDAATWIEAHKAQPFLVVVHARGGHPPWDASADDLKTMAPDGYLGIVEPRRAAEAIAKVRKHPARFKEDDRARAWALYDHAIDAHDAALGRLVAAVRAAGREDDTAIIVTSDVATNEGPPVPFAEPDTLDEPLLATPLVVRWARAASLAGRRVEAPTSSLDLGRTILGALGLPPPAAFQGVDLASLAAGTLTPGERPLLATRAGRFSVRWGSYVLTGGRQHEARMCDLSLDSACIADVRATSPIALEAVRRWAIGALMPVYPAPNARMPAQLDEHSIASLVRWGHLLDEPSAKEER
jgi:arylsulfatase A-like enzyme